ncbi:hypothetical protein TSUD_272370 [Trifolium subterraneum]|uniref:peroxidase n=1 Tax=Trifolium subterraneum TaxID=3900 RepID=A0A2Z6PEH2_TRISU|nr:hypothetical protein TSUD_272370 [Trifolium subterraneum]
MGSQSWLNVLIICLIAIIGATHAELQLGFYAKSCPKAEKIVLKYVHEHIPNAPSLAAALIRLHFHDCFVRGGPYWNVPTGRRDGLISKAADVFLGLPAPFHNLTTLLTLFGNVGLDATDLVLLSGAHTIGIGHCASVSNRLYNFTGKGDQDPDLDSKYAKTLKTFKCKSINDQTTALEMDPGSRNTFDLGYYKQVVKRRGLFQSDVALLKSSTTRSIVAQQLQSPEKFFVEFAKSMEKMGRINVKIGTEGEIRKHCAFVN